MGYTKDLTPQSANAAKSGNLLGSVSPEFSGENQLLVRAVAVDTSIVSGALVALTPSASGWITDTNPDNGLFIAGVLQEAPSSAAAKVNVCVGGFTYANFSSTLTCTAWAAEVDVTSDQICGHVASTTPTTRHLGWPVTSGSNTTAGNGIIFLDQPWALVDSST